MFLKIRANTALETLTYLTLKRKLWKLKSQTAPVCLNDRLTRDVF